MKQTTLTGNTIELPETDDETSGDRPTYWTQEACTVPAAQIDWNEHEERDITTVRFAELYAYTVDGEKYVGETIDILDDGEIIIVPTTNADGTPCYHNGTYHRISTDEHNIQKLPYLDRDAYTICG